MQRGAQVAVRRHPGRRPRRVLALLGIAGWAAQSLAFLPAQLPGTRPPTLILPGFGNDSNDYDAGEPPSMGPTTGVADKVARDASLVLGQDAQDSADDTHDPGLMSRLKRRGFDSVQILPVQRPEWLRILGGLLDSDFRAGKAPPETAFGWYLARVDEEVERIHAATGERVLLLGHSAGGWLARAALGRSGSLRERTRALVTLGAPHTLDENGEDQTQGALRYVEDNYPGAYHQGEGIEYVTVGGSAVLGVEEADRGTAEKESFISYERLAGRGDVVGDGIVPLASAHLEGATQITLPNAKHSIGTPAEWYGADEVIDEWLPEVTSRLAAQSLATLVSDTLR